MIVVLLSVFSAGGFVAGATVSVFCSQAASKAAPAKMQMYFFIGGCLTVNSVNYLRSWTRRLDRASGHLW